MFMFEILNEHNYSERKNKLDIVWLLVVDKYYIGIIA